MYLGKLMSRGNVLHPCINARLYVYFGSKVKMWSTWQITFCATLVVIQASTSLAVPPCTLQLNGYNNNN